MIISSQVKLAKHFGVTSASVRKWKRQPGFPDSNDGYDTEEISAWLDARGRDSQQKTQQAQQANTLYRVASAKLKKLQADKLERQEQIAQGNILPRDEATLSLKESITITRDRLLSLPKELCRCIPKKYHKALREEGGMMVANILADFARLSERVMETDVT